MRIMVAFDGSEASLNALDLAKEHARNFKASKIFIVTSLHGDMKEQVTMLEKSEQDLSRAKTSCEDDHIECETEILSRGTSAGEALIEYAVTNSMDEIMIGIQKTSKVGKLLFGSTAQFVILNSSCPVVTVH